MPDSVLRADAAGRRRPPRGELRAALEVLFSRARRRPRIVDLDTRPLPYASSFAIEEATCDSTMAASSSWCARTPVKRRCCPRRGASSRGSSTTRFARSRPTSGFSPRSRPARPASTAAPIDRPTRPLLALPRAGPRRATDRSRRLRRLASGERLVGPDARPGRARPRPGGRAAAAVPLVQYDRAQCASLDGAGATAP